MSARAVIDVDLWKGQWVAVTLRDGQYDLARLYSSQRGHSLGTPNLGYRHGPTAGLYT
jgi:hypothetical protein